MRDELVEVVFPYRGLRLTGPCWTERGETSTWSPCKSELRTLLKTASEAQRWPEYGATVIATSASATRWPCWIDELFHPRFALGTQWNERQARRIAVWLE